MVVVATKRSGKFNGRKILMTKNATLKFSTAATAMAVMLGTQQPRVTRAMEGEKVRLAFEFAANQSFTLTFIGERVVAGAMRLVEGREPTTRAMELVQQDTDTDTIDLFKGLPSDGRLRVNVVDDDGFSLDRSDATLACVDDVNKTFSVILAELLGLDVDSAADVGDHIESLRAKLVEQYGRRLAA